MPPGPPDSKPPRKGRRPSIDDTIDEADERERAAVATIERDVRDALSAGTSAAAGAAAADPLKLDLPRTRTPAEESMQAAIDAVRRLSPEWHVAENMARALDAIGDRFGEVARERDELAARVGRLEAIRASATKTIGRLKAWAAGSSLAACSAVAAVIFGLGVKRGHEDAEQAAAKEQARLVLKHERALTVERPLIDLTVDNRLGAHDRALGIDTRQPLTFPTYGAIP